jgi:hypothetical protein
VPHPTTLLIAAGVAVAGAATGVHLGRSTIGQINPAYFQDPEVPFYSDLVPGTHQRADWAQVQAQEYQASAAASPPPAGCMGCTWPAIPAPQQDAALVRFDQPAAAPAPRERAEAPVRIVIVEQPVAPDRAQVERYSRYQVARDGDPAPVEEADGEGDAGTQ